MDLTQELESIGKESLSSIREVFAQSVEGDPKMAIKKAEIALKTLGRLNGRQSTELKERALAFQVAKYAGVKGDTVLAHIMPDLLPALPPAEPAA